MTRILRTCVGALLLAAVAAYAATVLRDYSRYAPYYPYIAVDDGLANVSYSLATQGRYGFLASPVQGFTDLMRDRGFFNYGPWYFYSGAALVWLFGYSLTMIRAMHPAGIFAIAAVACWWFGRRGSIAAGALVALGLVHSFTAGQWPMVRPDIAVSVFAVAFIVTAGLAIERRSAGWWFLAGTSAGCAALTHLIAWALVPCSLLTLATALAGEPSGERRRERAVAAAVAVVLGLSAAAFMFYASFGFRVHDHLSTLRAYGSYLGGTTIADIGYRGVIAEHLRLAFWYLSLGARVALGASVAAGLVLLAAAWRAPGDARRRMLAALLPSNAVLLCYGASLAFYASHHTGYAILLQVGTWWCAGAAVSVALFLLARRQPASRPAVEAVLALVLVGVSGRLVSSEASNPRLGLVRTWVGIQNYLDKMAEFIPRGATVWGTAMSGIESPGRLQLVEFIDAVNIIERSRRKHVVDSSAVAPEYILWDYRLNRENLLQSLHRNALPAGQSRTDFGHALDLFGTVRYRVIGLVASTPYGVARVYERIANDADVPAKRPAVSVYDAATRSWDERLDGPMALDIRPTAAAVFNIYRSQAPSPLPADRSVVADLASGRYLLRVRIARSFGSSGGTIVMATPVPAVTEAIGDLGASMDVSPYAEGDVEAYLVREHAGGRLYVSQFDNGRGAAIEGVDVFRIRPRLDDDQLAERFLFRDLPQSGAAAPSVRTGLTAAGALTVDGDATRQGYQVSSPLVSGRAGSHVTVRAGFSAGQGTVCLGALNGTAQWLANGGDPSRDFAFTVDATAAFRVVFYNCNAADTGNAPSRFTVSRVQYAAVDAGLYVDRLLAVRDPARAAASIQADPRVRAFPAGLVVTPDQIGRAPLLLVEADLSFKASTATSASTGWAVTANADGPFSYLLKSKPQNVDDDRRLVAHVHVRTGGVTIGLLNNGAWAGQVHLTAAGEFIAVIEPPAHGVYEVVVANNLSGPSRATEVVVASLGWVRR